MSTTEAPLVVGRYVLHAAIARGGMATIHLARLLGAEGWSRMVAAKRLHPQLTTDPEFVEMFLDEARIASKIHHPNVVPVLDVVHTGTEVILVQEYVHGVPLDRLLRAAREEEEEVPAAVVVAVAADMLAGLHAAHEATDELGAALEIVHRDVSPQNVLVGADGIARVLDFGVAKAQINLHVTRAGTFKGKLTYTSPEQMRGAAGRATDVYAAAVVIWEALAGRRMHAGRTDVEICAAVTRGDVVRLLDAVDPESASPDRWSELSRLDPIVARGLALAAEDRWPRALEMADALLDAVPRASAAEVARWVKHLGKAYLEGREKIIVTEESTWRQRPSLDAGPPEPDSGATLRPSALAVESTRRRRVERGLAAALLALGAVLAGVIALLVRRPADPAPAALPPPAAPEAIAAITVTAEPPPPPLPPPHATTPAPSAAPPPGPRPFVPRGPLIASPVPRMPPPAATTAPDCNPPFYFDGKKKVFKTGCL
jgi:eukaryotic-like serine/threonine-protein kinase